jgi:hypothetical protein
VIYADSYKNVNAKNYSCIIQINLSFVGGMGVPRSFAVVVIIYINTIVNMELILKNIKSNPVQPILVLIHVGYIILLLRDVNGED